MSQLRGPDQQMNCEVSTKVVLLHIYIYMPGSAKKKKKKKKKKPHRSCLHIDEKKYESTIRGPNQQMNCEVSTKVVFLHLYI
jgi:hypothetical protein